VDVTLVPIKTSGDKLLDARLATMGGKGLFVKELEEALLEDEIDLAVHSLKDLPVALPEGLGVGAVMTREDPLDALVSRDGLRFSELPAGARVGTSSLRRQVQLLHRRHDLQIVPLRGNVETRLRKLETLGLDAIVLAAAGLVRLGLQDRMTERLPADVSLPAIGQGAIGIEIREDDARMAALIDGLDDRETRLATTAERAFLRRLGGSCITPIAAFGRIEGDVVHLTGMVASLDGKRMVRKIHRGDASEPEAVGYALAELLLASGAEEILREIDPLLPLSSSSPRSGRGTGEGTESR
jgi:hydroxymethylbilane synthase